MMPLCGLLCLLSSVHSQNSSPSNSVVIDAEKERTAIESRDALFSKYLLNADSVSLASMYASDGMIGCSSGPKILTALGGWIRNTIKNDSRHVKFKTVTLNSDGPLLIETGIAETSNDKGELKSTGKYLVVWKKEDGVWKLYRDIGL
jgi:ketosteroid isomerase-like protein